MPVLIGAAYLSGAAGGITEPRGTRFPGAITLQAGIPTVVRGGVRVQ